MDLAATIDGDDSEFQRSKQASLVRAEVLKGFNQLIFKLGGSPVDILQKFRINPAVLEDPNGVIPFATVVRLLEYASSNHACPDFGMQLGAAQGPMHNMGPLGLVMRNSPALGDAFRYAVDHIHVYSSAVNMGLERISEGGLFIWRYDILVENLPQQRQAVEHAITTMHKIVPELSGGPVRAREIWFSHEALAPVAAYHSHFATRVRFGQPMSGVLLTENDLKAVIPNTDRQLHALATGYVDDRFPSPDKSFSIRLQTIMRSLLGESDCTLERVCSQLAIHPRTLQRRLKEEGESFASLKDKVRREIAMQQLRRRRVPLVHVAAALGYSELSSLAASCYRWFSVSPRQMRNMLSSADEGTGEA